MTAVEIAVGGLLASLLVVPALLPVAAAPGDGSQRIAFTDDRDGLWSVEVSRLARGNQSDPQWIEPEFTHRMWGSRDTEHEGEASAVPDDSTDRNDIALVSTRAPEAGGVVDPDGEVLIDLSPNRSDDYGYSFAPVTCNDAAESHPVIDPTATSFGPGSYRVAFASDADGDWDIYLATVRKFPWNGDCSDWTIENLTGPGNDGSDELWPAWTPDGHLVFSGSGEGELDDLYALYFDGPNTTVRRLTDTPDAEETQPTVTELSSGEQGGSSLWVAFTTTEFNPDRTLGVLEFPGEPEEPAADLPMPDRHEIFPTYDRQASEPSWSGSSTEPLLAYTTTSDDPYGDVEVVQVELFEGSPRAVWLFLWPVADEAGVAESHPTWSEQFGEPDPNNNRARGQLTYTRRAIDADIGDVRDDGTARRAISSATWAMKGRPVGLDEAGPSYSPDGQRVVYSRALPPADYHRPDDVPGRELVVANADGTDAEPLMEAGEDANLPRHPNDYDTDPVWSPDGTEIAFVRQSAGDGYGPPEIWVYDLEEESARIVTREPNSPYETYYDSEPSWAPDGRRLVISRQVEEAGLSLAASRAQPEPSSRADRHLWVVDTTGDDPDARLEFRPSCPPTRVCGAEPVPGRSPAWSPDGTRIVFDHSGALRMVDLDPNGPMDGTWRVASPTAVTGFGADGEPTPSRATISAAEDPAWSPDGREIAFAGQPAGQPDQRGIWAVRPDGTGLRLVTDARGPDTEPAYRPSADVSLGISLSGSPAKPGTPLVATFTIRNHGPATASHVRLTTGFTSGGTARAIGPPAGCRADGSGCMIASLPRGATVTYTVRLTYRGERTGTVTGAVTAATSDPRPGNNRDVARFVVSGSAADLRVRVRLDEPVGYVGGERRATITVRNAGPRPATGVHLEVSYPDQVANPPEAPLDCTAGVDICDLGTLGPGERRSFEVDLDTVRDGDGALVATVTGLTADPLPANNRDRVPLSVLQPTIRLLPAVARPGTVTMAYGENMPPGTDVVLEWNRGITVDGGPFTVDDDGTLRAPMILVRKDQLGERTLLATSVGDLFTPVEGDMLVVQRLMSAPDFLARG